MTALTWAIRLIILSFLLVFATQNTDVVTLRFVLGYFWEAPLVLVLVAFFSGGAMMGVLSLSGVIFRKNRETSRLKRALAKAESSVKPASPPNA